ncbi:acetylornithine transaminase [Reyranella sp. CPCC 100927]|uniref:acetylornithine transaminase n=1 Tax=Reyranella sp. CPCC 100927 TaxID=2599616 RepID=UPI0011B6EEEF|nr:acetylornithine transaminase [Reyranella sp. CPCC 100927]TWT03782.1 acetylornithine transaminase [Reyranella sp. CPCC 100927]
MSSAPDPVQSLMDITQRPDAVFVRGDGSWLTDHRGRRHLDFVQGWAVNTLGHCPPQIARALADQAAKLITPSPAFYNEPSLQLAGLLTRHSCFDRVFFCNSGGEANEGAIKLARKWGSLHKGGAYGIITFDDGFHGRTLATMSASGKPGWDKLFEPKVPGFAKAKLNDIASVEALIDSNTVAVMLEPVQGESGVVPSTLDFMRDLHALTRKHGLLLIFDEIQTGMGRSGDLFAYQHYGVEPDIMTLGKGIGGGVPLAALLAKEAVSCFAHGDQGGTFNGNPLMTAVGVAIMQTLLAPGFLDQVRDSGAYLSHRLSGLAAEFGMPGERGLGLLRALKLATPDGARIVEAARLLQPVGLLVNAPRPNLLRFMPALTVTKAEIDRMIELLREALRLVLAPARAA